MVDDHILNKHRNSYLIKIPTLASSIDLLVAFGRIVNDWEFSLVSFKERFVDEQVHHKLGHVDPRHLAATKETSGGLFVDGVF